MVNMSSLLDKVAIVTGASKGIGAGIAEALGAAGARVAINYSSDRKGAERVTQTIIDGGGEAIAIGADVSKAADVGRLFNEVDTAFGRLDILVNNAGFFRFGAFAAITEESFQRASLAFSISSNSTKLSSSAVSLYYGKPCTLWLCSIDEMSPWSC
jgi:3-oxoacyl-[acyl-carrier protein] reductase